MWCHIHFPHIYIDNRFKNNIYIYFMKKKSRFLQRACKLLFAFTLISHNYLLRGASYTAFIICFDNFAIAPSGVCGSTFIWQRVRINSHLYANNTATRIITIYWNLTRCSCERRGEFAAQWMLLLIENYYHAENARALLAVLYNIFIYTNGAYAPVINRVDLIEMNII